MARISDGGIHADSAVWAELPQLQISQASLFMPADICTCARTDGCAELNDMHTYLKYAKVFGPLIAMVLAIVITASARLDKHGIKIVGKIPRGLPPVTVSRQRFLGSPYHPSFLHDRSLAFFSFFPVVGPDFTMSPALE